MKWIKTSEQLPQVGRCVLAWAVGSWQGNYAVMVYWDGERFKTDLTTRVYGKNEVSHWCEVTEPENI